MNEPARQATSLMPDSHQDQASCHTASTRQIREITPADLPLCCPMPDECLWNAHPRIYLPLDKQGTALCPYCGTEYVMKTARETDRYNC